MERRSAQSLPLPPPKRQKLSSSPMATTRMPIVSPKSPMGLRSGVGASKGATVFLSHVRRTFARYPVDYTGELVRLLDDIVNFTRIVSTAVTESNTVPEYAGHSAHSALEVTANGATQLLYRLLAHDGYCCIILAKDHTQPLTFPAGVPHGNYVVCVTPLDIDPVAGTAATAGTLFSVYKRRSSTSLPGRGIDLKQRICDQVAAGYVSYSSATTLHYSMGHGLYSFQMHPVAQQYFLTSQDTQQIPDNASVMYINRAILRQDTPVAAAARHVLSELKCPILSSGSLVSDLHLLLRSGGVLVAQDVHLLCEAAPIAYLVEQAGGIAVDEFGDRVLDMNIADDHDVRVTLVAGSKPDVARIGAFTNSHLMDVHDKAATNENPNLNNLSETKE